MWRSLWCFLSSCSSCRRTSAQVSHSLEQVSSIDVSLLKQYHVNDCFLVLIGPTLSLSRLLQVIYLSTVSILCHSCNILPCIVWIVDLVVDWARHDLKPRYVHIRRDGLDLLIDQNSLYLGRTRLSERGLAYGDLSLTLSRVRLSDAGTYHCFIPQMDTRAEVTLHVVSPVSVSLTKDHSGSPELRCESRGWFPEPELVWLDSEGTVLTGARTEAQRGVNEETFSVSSRLSVEQSPGNSFTCRVRHQETRQIIDFSIVSVFST
uniref:Ig-like domain-containing protein n=1 Tax=Neogobius melanostomus TaxID=47308 RepID=A0A8C6U024_9GOBI